MNIYESIAKIMNEVIPIAKDKQNTQQNFKYRGIEEIMNVMHPILAKNKVFIVPYVLEQIREDRVSSKGNSLIYSVCKMKYVFYAEDGTFVEAVMIGEGMDSGDKATNKAMAIAMKYALCQTFCIPTEDEDDPEKETTEENPKTQMEDELNQKITPQKARIITEMMIDRGLNIEKQLRSNYGITNVNELTNKQYASILNALKNLPIKKKGQ